jgi:hypothetical protein
MHFCRFGNALPFLCRRVDLSSNSFSGIDILSRSTSVTFLDLSRNHIRGQFVDHLDLLANLRCGTKYRVPVLVLLWSHQSCRAAIQAQRLA